MDTHASPPAPIDVAIAAAQASGRILRQAFGKTLRIARKGLVNLVTEQDHRSEETIVRTILAAFPTHAIWAEERGAIGAPSEHRWIVDPLDGTTNYAHGYPFFCVSIAYERQGQVEVGVIFDPLRRELFVAQRGVGVTLNGRPVHVSQTDRLINSLVETGFPYERDRLGLALRQFDRLAYETQALRRSGAAALGLAYVAAGRLDGFWEATLAPWDHAAGALMVQEAGGQVSRLSGAPYQIEATEIVASNGLIHTDLLYELVQSVD